MRLLALDLPVVQTLAGALLAMLAVLLAFRVWWGAGTGLALCLPVRVAPWGLLLALCLLAALGATLAVGLSLPSALFVAAHPLSCLWGVAVVSKFIIKDLALFSHVYSLAEVATRSRLNELTVTSFLRYLPKKLGGSLGYDWHPYRGAPAGGIGPFAALTPPSLDLVTWTVDLFRQNQALQLHVYALASLLFSTPGLLLAFLGSLPWIFLGDGRVLLCLPSRFVPLALLLERLFGYAGFSHIRFTLEGSCELTLVASLDELLAVVRLTRRGRREGPCPSTQALEAFLRTPELNLEPGVQTFFYRPLEPTRSSRAIPTSQFPLIPVRRRR
jgi:hypothetical protein